MKTIQGKALGINFDTVKVLHDIDIQLSQNEFSVISGQTASGKTLLSKILSGVLNPSSGTIRWDGLTNPRGRSKTRTKIPLLSIPQEGLFLTARELVEQEIAFGLNSLALAKPEFDQRLQDALKLSGLSDKPFAKTALLSAGQKKMLAIASAVALDPDFLIIDDPFAGLDPFYSRELIKILIGLKEKGRGVVIVSNDLERVLAHVDRLILLKAGRVMADALPDRVLPYLEEHGVRRPPGKRTDMSWI